MYSSIRFGMGRKMANRLPSVARWMLENSSQISDTPSHKRLSMLRGRGNLYEGLALFVISLLVLAFVAMIVGPILIGLFFLIVTAENMLPPK